MGHFNEVNVKLPCPRCGAVLDDFQSKDGGISLTSVDPDQISSFYTTCNSILCRGEWIEFSRSFTKKKQVSRKTPFTLEEVKALGFKSNCE